MVDTFATLILARDHVIFNVNFNEQLISYLQKIIFLTSATGLGISNDRIASFRAHWNDLGTTSIT